MRIGVRPLESRLVKGSDPGLLDLLLVEELLPAGDQLLKLFPPTAVRSDDVHVAPVLGELALELGDLHLAGGDLVRVELAQRNGQVVLSIADDGEGIEGDDGGTGLSIVRALVRDELRGTLDLVSDGGLRAEVVFPP